MKRIYRDVLVMWLLLFSSFAQAQSSARVLSATIVTQKNEAVEGVSLTVVSSLGQKYATSDSQGNFSIEVPDLPLTLKIEGRFIATREVRLGRHDPTTDLVIRVEFQIPPIHQSLVITAAALDPTIDHHNDVVYKNTLFSRDDQLLFN